MKHAIPFVVVLWPNEQHVHSHTFADTVKAAFPDCCVDWAEGENWTLHNIDRLRSIGCPEIFLEGERALLGQRFELSVQPLPFVDATLSGIITSVDRDLGDAMCFQLAPYNPGNLHSVAKALAEAVNFRYDISYESSFDVSIVPTPCLNPLETARGHLSLGEKAEMGNGKWQISGDAEVKLYEMTDWEHCFRKGLRRFLSQKDVSPDLSDVIHSFISESEYVSVAAEDIRQVITPDRAWIVDWVNASHQNDLLLSSNDSHAFISLSGVPKGIFVDA